MAKKQYFLIVDTETTVESTVADFGAVICDRNGQIFNQCSILVKDHFDTKELFYDPKDNGFWGKKSAVERKEKYVGMLQNGSRMLASVAAINRWLERAKGKYNPELTAYNLPFDLDKCQNTGIDLSVFSSRFCLWAASVGNLANNKKYRQFVLENHKFNKPTEQGNMTFQTNAEVMASFVAGNMLPDEPHTALEDIIGYELPVLVSVLKKAKWRENIKAYNWRDFQVKNNFQAK